MAKRVKRLLIVFLLLLCSIYLLSAAEPTTPQPKEKLIVSQLSKGFDLQGGYSDFFSISVKILDAPALGYTAGMPFDLMSDNLNPASTDNGILIANWSMLTNRTNFNFKVSCTSLKPVDPTAAKDPKNEIKYILTFIYELSIYEKDTSRKMGATKFMVASDGSFNDNTPRNPIDDTTIIDEQSLMGTNTGQIYIKLKDENYSKPDPNQPSRNLDLAVDGDYQGTVKIVMELVE